MSDRTGEQIVADCNALAREFYRLAGYAVPDGYRFDRAVTRRARMAWAQAALAYEVIRGTDVQNALAGLGEESAAAGERRT